MKRTIKIHCKTCGVTHIMKIPFKYRKKTHKIEIICFNCGATTLYQYADKITHI